MNNSHFCAGSVGAAGSKKGQLCANVGWWRGGLVGKAFLLILMVFLAGCGDIDWFPEYVRQPTTPDEFSFPAKTGTEKNVLITSDPITVAGLTAATSTISITGSVGSNSKYSINEATATDAAGTVKNGDKVTVTHTTANALGTTTVSTLSIGNVSGRFLSTTRTVDVITFEAPISLFGTTVQTEGPVSSVDGIAGIHVISIKDSRNSGNAQYGISDDLLDPNFFTSNTQTIPFLNGRRIFVRNLIANVQAGATTTLTIDGIDFPVSLVIVP